MIAQSTCMFGPVLQACELRQYQEGDIILGAGELLDRMYIVAAGRCILSQVSSSLAPSMLRHEHGWVLSS